MRMIRSCVLPFSPYSFHRNLTALLNFHHQHSTQFTTDSVSTKLDFDDSDSPTIPIIPSITDDDTGDPTISGPVVKPVFEPVTCAVKLGDKDHRLSSSPTSRAGKDLDPVLYDRGIREAMYNIHAETVTLTSASVYEGKTKSVTEIYVNNPEFLVFEVRF